MPVLDPKATCEAIAQAMEDLYPDGKTTLGVQPSASIHELLDQSCTAAMAFHAMGVHKLSPFSPACAFGCPTFSYVACFDTPVLDDRGGFATRFGQLASQIGAVSFVLAAPSWRVSAPDPEQAKVMFKEGLVPERDDKHSCISVEGVGPTCWHQLYADELDDGLGPWVDLSVGERPNTTHLNVIAQTIRAVNN